MLEASATKDKNGRARWRREVQGPPSPPSPGDGGRSRTHAPNVADRGPALSPFLWGRVKKGTRESVRLLLSASGIYASEVEAVRTYQFHGCSFRVALSNKYEKYRWDAMVAGTKEPETIQWIEQDLQDGDIFVDVGANIGNYTVYAGVRHPRLQIFSFEPEPNSFAQLVKNVQLNRIDATCFLIPLNDTISADFLNLKWGTTAGESDHQFGRTLDSHDKAFTPTHRIGTSSWQFDALVSKGLVPQPNHVKIDVDGLEECVLKGMDATLADRRLRSVLCEVTGTEDKVESIVALFEGHGFTCSRRAPRGEGNYIFKRA